MKSVGIPGSMAIEIDGLPIKNGVIDGLPF
jgi:hypothetical protein